MNHDEDSRDDPFEDDFESPEALPFLDDVLTSPDPLPTKVGDDDKGRPPEGSLCSVKNLYEGPGSTAFNTHWVEQYPDDLLTAHKDKTERRSHALLVKHRKKQTLEISGDRFQSWSLCIWSIRIQSQLLRNVLKDMFEGYPGLTLDLKKVEFVRPFRPLWDRWDYLEQVVQQPPSTSEDATGQKFDAESIEHTKLLYDLLVPVFEKDFRRFNDLTGHGVITFDYLWALFKPGDLVVDSSGPHLLVHKVVKGEYILENTQEYVLETNRRRVGYSVTSIYVDWDGEKFGFHTCRLQLNRFDGTCPITSLDIYPLVYHQDPSGLRKALLQRNRKFEALAGRAYKTYKELIHAEWGQTWVRALPIPSSHYEDES